MGRPTDAQHQARFNALRAQGKPQSPPSDMPHEIRPDSGPGPITASNDRYARGPLTSTVKYPDRPATTHAPAKSDSVLATVGNYSAPVTNDKESNAIIGSTATRRVPLRPGTVPPQHASLGDVIRGVGKWMDDMRHPKSPE